MPSRKNPDAIMSAIDEAAKKRAGEQAAAAQQNSREAEFANPKKPEVGD